jgi:hypothetical protein
MPEVEARVRQPRLWSAFFICLLSGALSSAVYLMISLFVFNLMESSTIPTPGLIFGLLVGRLLPPGLVFGLLVGWLLLGFRGGRLLRYAFLAALVYFVAAAAGDLGRSALEGVLGSWSYVTQLGLAGLVGAAGIALVTRRLGPRLSLRDVSLTAVAGLLAGLVTSPLFVMVWGGLSIEACRWARSETVFMICRGHGEDDLTGWLMLVAVTVWQVAVGLTLYHRALGEGWRAEIGR